MTLYRLCEWEENGYHDSYGKLAYYDSDLNTLGVVEHWATAYHGGLDTSQYLRPYGLALEQARRALESHIYEYMVTSNLQYIYNPTEAQLRIGDRVRTSKHIRNKAREVIDCVKCHGLGQWVNPNDDTDKRTCFTCKGTGKKFGKVTGGWSTISSDTIGEIIDSYQYNKRSSVNYTIRTDEGEFFRCGAKSLRVAQEPKSKAYWQRKAFELSFEFNFKSAVSRFGGWLSTDWCIDAASEIYWATCPYCGRRGKVRKNTGQLDCCGTFHGAAAWYRHCIEAQECDAAHYDQNNYHIPS